MCRACGMTDLLSLLEVSYHSPGNNINKLWMNTITPSKLNDKLRGFCNLNLFKVLMHYQEIYIDQKLHKQSLMKMLSFIWVSNSDFFLKAKVLHWHLTLWLPLLTLLTAQSSCNYRALKLCFGRLVTCL